MLGSGVGNDLFLISSKLGSKGKVFGIDFSEKMVQRS